MAGYIWRCDLSKQYERYHEEIDRAVRAVLKKGVYTLGKEVEFFEKEFASYIGRAHGIAVASGTDALILALKASGLRPNDEVITTTYAPTPVPTAIALAGGVPVFADIEPDTCLMDPGEIERKASRKTRFVIPVHLFGFVCDMPFVNRIARRKGLAVIEDAAQAHGAMLGGKKAGSFANLACFSFYPTKNLGAYGDGGLILTDDRRSKETLRLLRNYGKKYNPFDSEMLGCNSRLDELQAAILRVKLCHLDEMNRKRARLVQLYKEALEDTPLEFLSEYRGVRPNYHVLTVLCRKGRDDLAKFLESRDIQTNVYYPKPLHMMRAFKQYVRKGDRFPVSEAMSGQALALPLYPELPENMVIYIADKIKEYFSCKGR